LRRDALYILQANIHIEKYKAAEMLLNLADTFDTRYPKRLLKFEEKPEVVPTGSIYLSSAILFIISLESLINLLHLLLLKKEFDPDIQAYDRITIKPDIDLRLLYVCTFFAMDLNHKLLALIRTVGKICEITGISKYSNSWEY